jgi:hypothetical protein
VLHAGHDDAPGRLYVLTGQAKGDRHATKYWCARLPARPQAHDDVQAQLERPVRGWKLPAPHAAPHT